MRLQNLRLGSSDMARSKAFYDATFGVFGVKRTPMPDEYPIAVYKLPCGANFAFGPTRDGKPACGANGGTILFEADSPEDVAAWHAAGLANGGTCEGAPEVKTQARGAFGAYLRDPDGNKLAAYHGLRM